MKRVIVQINIRRTSQILLNAVLQPLTQEQSQVLLHLPGEVEQSRVGYYL